MKSVKIGFIALASVAMLLLGACGNQAATPNNNASVQNSDGHTDHTHDKTDGDTDHTHDKTDGHTDHTHDKK